LTSTLNASTLTDMSNSVERGSIWAFALLAASACGAKIPDPGGSEHECSLAAECAPSASICEAAACVEGQCVLEPKAAGAACDDGLFCTVGEACDGKGACTGGTSPCNELAPGIPRCNDAENMCEVCSDGRPLVDGECRCPYWNCVARGGAYYCAATDVSEENNVSCYYDGLTT